jgi:ATP-dependent helicase HrpA
MTDARITELKSLLPRCLLPDWVRLGSRLVRLLRDQHHPDRHDALLDRLLQEARASAALREQRRRNVPVVSYPPELPITARKDEILAAIRGNQVVVVAGETGSGKTTQLPKLCLEAGLGIEAKIGCTQPRRVAALSISRRIADELNVSWGREVGCKIRFDDRSSAQTYIKLMTDGILLAETQGDPELSEYNAIILDEAHERSLNIDFLIGYLKGLLARRKDLKLIVTSATIDTAAFSRHFNDAPVIEVSGRMFPVEVVYAPLAEEAAEDETAPRSGGSAERRTPHQPGNAALSRDAATEGETLAAGLRAELATLAEERDLTYVDAAVQAAERILYETRAGDVLIFMPSERDIRETGDQLDGRFLGEVEVIPLFGRLSAGDQQRVFASSARRKVVVATNIAETSLTIPGIRYVVDTGLARISRYSPRTRTKRLPIEPVSQSSANQRKGRAGRVQDGICIRLYAEDDFAGRPAFTQPEIQRANLAEVILRMKAFHLGDIEVFPFLQPPTPAAIVSGYTLLQELGALDPQSELTPLGRDLARLPIDPTLGRMLLQAQHEHATRELLIIAAGLSIQDPRERPLDQQDAARAAHQRFNDPQSDFLALLNLWNAFHEQWEKLRTQGLRRKFCRQHFLSYLRMREWQDLHEQLESSLEDLAVLREIETRHLRQQTAPASAPASLSSIRNVGEGQGEEMPGRREMNRPRSPAHSPAPGRGEGGASARYDAIHRSILAGLIGHVAHHEDRNAYKAAGNRQVVVFPGSALHAKGEPVKQRFAKGAKPPPKPKSSQPEWIVAGEIVETSQLFARTLAAIEPGWIYELAPHCCKVAHQNPNWSARDSQVMIEQVVTLHGLEVQRTKVAYGNLNASDATAIFIRAALVEERLLRSEADEADETPVEERGGKLRVLNPAAPAQPASVPPQYRFLAHNRALRHKLEHWQTRLRRNDFGDLDQAMCAAYALRLENISSRDELHRWLREPGRQESLCFSEAELTGGQKLGLDAEAFPDAVPVGGQPVALSYAYAPGEEHDGVTVRLPFTLAQSASAALLEWAVPGLREEKVNELLRALPKAIRRDLMPLAPKVAEIVRDFAPSGTSFLRDLGRFLEQRYRVAVPESAWPPDALPAHLRTRIEVVGHDEKPLAASRDLEQLRQHFQQREVNSEPAHAPEHWQRVARQWERFGLRGWTFGDLPERLTVCEGPGLPLYGWLGLQCEEGGVSVRLFRSRDAARATSLFGVQRLVELAIQKDLGWVEKDLRALAEFEPLYASLGTLAELRETALENAKRFVLPAEPLPVLTQAAFDAAVVEARRRLPGLAAQLMGRIGEVLRLYQQARVKLGGAGLQPVQAAHRQNARAPGKGLQAVWSEPVGSLFSATSPTANARAGHPVAGELGALVPPRFLEQVPGERLAHLPRYLKALMVRAERAALNPIKDRERAAQVGPWLETMKKLAAQPDLSAEGRRLREELRWMIEEFKVSLFAQELGTAVPVSPKRLEQQLERIREAGGTA